MTERNGDKRMPHDPDDIGEWMAHMDLHLTEHDLRHAGLALRAAWPHVSMFLHGILNERDTWRELAQKLSAPSAIGTPSQEAIDFEEASRDHRDAERYRWLLDQWSTDHGSHHVEWRFSIGCAEVYGLEALIDKAMASTDGKDHAR